MVWTWVCWLCLCLDCGHPLCLSHSDLVLKPQLQSHLLLEAFIQPPSHHNSQPPCSGKALLPWGFSPLLSFIFPLTHFNLFSQHIGCFWKVSVICVLLLLYFQHIICYNGRSFVSLCSRCSWERLSLRSSPLALPTWSEKLSQVSPLLAWLPPSD